MKVGLDLHRPVTTQVNCWVVNHRGTNPPPKNRRADRIKHSWITLCEESENPGQAGCPTLAAVILSEVEGPASCTFCGWYRNRVMWFGRIVAPASRPAVGWTFRSTHVSSWFPTGVADPREMKPLIGYAAANSPTCHVREADADLLN
jgi:hypothetical protein